MLYGVLCVQICTGLAPQNLGLFRLHMFRCIQLQLSKRPTVGQVYRLVSDLLLGSPVVSRLTLSSIFRLRHGNCSNRADWGRYLLLVCRWIWRCRAPLAFPSLPHRLSYHDCSYFVHRSRILLLSDLDAEQTIVVVLLDHFCRMYT